MSDDTCTIRWNNYDIMKAYKHKSSKKDISEKKRRSSRCRYKQCLEQTNMIFISNYIRGVMPTSKSKYSFRSGAKQKTCFPFRK